MRGEARGGGQGGGGRGVVRSREIRNPRAEDRSPEQSQNVGQGSDTTRRSVVLRG